MLQKKNDSWKSKLFRLEMHVHKARRERLMRVLVRKNWSGEAGLPISIDYGSLFINIS